MRAGRTNASIVFRISYRLVLYRGLRRDNFQHHISQLGIAGQQLDNNLKAMNVSSYYF